MLRICPDCKQKFFTDIKTDTIIKQAKESNPKLKTICLQDGLRLMFKESKHPEKFKSSYEITED